MIYLLRHAERIDQSNHKKEKQNWINSLRYKTNPYDIPLSLFGVSQAYINFGKILKNYSGGFNYIYTSPMTRCVQSALQFQKYIMDKFNVLPLIRIDYGLSVNLFKENEMFNIGSNIKLIGDKFIVTKMFEFIDKNIDLDKIYKRYGSNRFDTNYISLIDRNGVNNEQTYTDAINSRINTIKNIAKNSDKSKLTIICAHCETFNLIFNFLNKKWLTNGCAPKYSYVGGFKIGIGGSKNNKLTFLEMI